MISILHIGMDVHSDKHSLCAFSREETRVVARNTVPNDIKYILKFIQSMKSQYGRNVEIICGYEAGCLGYSLYRELTEYDVTCKILAPSTIPTVKKDPKTDPRDAKGIAEALANGTCSFVNVPTPEDEEIKDYLMLRDDRKGELKRWKQRVLSYCLRHHLQYEGKTWSKTHRKWLRTVQVTAMQRKVLDEMLAAIDQAEASIAEMEKEIDRICHLDRYEENVNKLICLRGIKELTALSFLVEVGDFQRFPNAGAFASYLGLIPQEHTSNQSRHMGSITKAGNRHLRMLLTESAQCYTRGNVGYVSKELQKKQSHADPKTIAYANRAKDRLLRKYKRMTHQGKNGNLAKTAVARELACFIWGIMNGRTD